LGVLSKADELVKLDALRKSGVLSQEEFESEKAKLLGIWIGNWRSQIVNVDSSSEVFEDEPTHRGSSAVAGVFLIVAIVVLCLDGLARSGDGHLCSRTPQHLG
jgi:hypothetical protein